eukprot:4294591-Pleurochrysis_carterae.AAC.1
MLAVLAAPTAESHAALPPRLRQDTEVYQGFFLYVILRRGTQQASTVAQFGLAVEVKAMAVLAAPTAESHAASPPRLREDNYERGAN